MTDVEMNNFMFVNVFNSLIIFSDFSSRILELDH